MDKDSDFSVSEYKFVVSYSFRLFKSITTYMCASNAQGREFCWLKIIINIRSRFAGFAKRWLLPWLCYCQQALVIAPSVGGCDWLCCRRFRWPNFRSSILRPQHAILAVWQLSFRLCRTKTPEVAVISWLWAGLARLVLSGRTPARLLSSVGSPVFTNCSGLSWTDTVSWLCLAQLIMIH